MRDTTSEEAALGWQGRSWHPRRRQQRRTRPRNRAQGRPAPLFREGGAVGVKRRQSGL